MAWWKIRIFFPLLHSWRMNCTFGRGSILLWLFTCLHKSYLLKRTSFVMKPLLVGKNKKCELVLPLKNGCWVLINLLCFSDFVSTIWASIVTCCVQTSSWDLLTFGCGGWNFELHWAKSIIRLGFNSLSSFVVLCTN